MKLTKSSFIEILQVAIPLILIVSGIYFNKTPLVIFGVIALALVNWVDVPKQKTKSPFQEPELKMVKIRENHYDT